MRTSGFLLAVVASLVSAAPAQAVTFTVAGGADGAGSCTATSCTTIRAALLEASRQSGPDTIALPARAYQVNQGQLLVNSAVTITGASAATTSITGDGKSGRIFNVGADQQVTISHVTISSGAAISSADGDGGNVRVNPGATLLLDHVRVTDGLALRGGGIAATTGTRVTITRSLIDNNVTTGSTGAPSREGGALIVLGNPQLAANVLQISDSTIADNDSSQGPGIVLRGNPADSAVLDRVTIARNAAGTNSIGAGIGNPSSANVRIGSSIVAFNTGDGTPVQCDVRPTSTGGNIDTGTSCGFTGPADRSSTDPQISALLTVAGGETPVLTIPATSPAVDFAPNCNQADQRDLSRPQGKSCDSGAYEFDQTADTAITAGPNDPGNDATPTFSFIADEPGATFQCRVDSAPFTACSSPHTTAQLAPGGHTFDVRAIDSGGNTDPTPASQTFVIDLAAPNTLIDTGPTGSVSSTSALFTFSSTEGNSTFQCALDGSAFGPCPVSYTGLSQGSHTFQVRATDAAGNPDATPASRTWIVDTVAPSAPVVTSPNNNALLMTNTVAFNGTAEPGTTVELREGTTLRGSAIASGTGNWTIVMGAVPDGPHTYAARAIDAATNTSAATNRTVTVDTVLPDTTIAGPSGLINDDTPTFTFTSEPNATFECSVDGVAHTACPTPFTTAVLSQGAHTLSVRAVDQAGNRDNTPATRNFTVDTIAPAAPNVTSPADGVRLASSSVRFQGLAEPHATVRLVEGTTTLATPEAGDAGAWVIDLTDVSDGTHVYTLRAVDAAANASPPVTRTVHVDTGAPAAPVVTSGPDGPVNTASPQFAFTGDDGATFECALDAPEFAPCTSPKPYSGLAEGAHTFRVRAVDAAGNRGAAATRAFTVDTTPPAVPTVVSGPDGTTTNASPGFGFTSEPGTTVECRLDGPGGPGSFAACASPLSFTGLAPGDYTFFVRSTDAAGNAQTSSRSFTVTAVQAAQTPTPTPTATPTPVAQQTVVVGPASGKVLVRVKGSNKFEELDVTKGIPLGSEVDARKGRVQLRAIPKAGRPPETADFYDGMFIVTQKGGVTDLKLSEPLDCAKRSRARAAAKKPKTRKLWGSGKGSFRTTGSYSAATVRGTIWLVQDTCTTTLTRVTQGVVGVRDFQTKKTVLVKKGKRYTAKQKQR